MEQRQPNTKCGRCGKPIYRRPFELEQYKRGVFCGRECYNLTVWGRLPNQKGKPCLMCGTAYKRDHNNRISKYCSRACANRARRGMTYAGGKAKTSSQRNMEAIKKEHRIKHCMVRGCKYGKTLDVHRLVPGHKGGKYEIGNMFAICPNHHAEETRGLIVLVLVGRRTLVAVDRER